MKSISALALATALSLPFAFAALPAAAQTAAPAAHTPMGGMNHAGGMHHGLWVVAIHVEDRRFHHQGDIGRIGRGA